MKNRSVRKRSKHCGRNSRKLKDGGGLFDTLTSTVSAAKTAVKSVGTFALNSSDVQWHFANQYFVRCIDITTIQRVYRDQNIEVLQNYTFTQPKKFFIFSTQKKVEEEEKIPEEENTEKANSAKIDETVDDVAQEIEDDTPIKVTTNNDKLYKNVGTKLMFETLNNAKIIDRTAYLSIERQLQDMIATASDATKPALQNKLTYFYQNHVCFYEGLDDLFYILDIFKHNIYYLLWEGSLLQYAVIRDLIDNINLVVNLTPNATTKLKSSLAVIIQIVCRMANGLSSSVGDKLTKLAEKASENFNLEEFLANERAMTAEKKGDSDNKDNTFQTTQKEVAELTKTGQLSNTETQKIDYGYGYGIVVDDTSITFNNNNKQSYKWKDITKFEVKKDSMGVLVSSKNIIVTITTNTNNIVNIKIPCNENQCKKEEALMQKLIAAYSLYGSNNEFRYTKGNSNNNNPLNITSITLNNSSLGSLTINTKFIDLNGTTVPWKQIYSFKVRFEDKNSFTGYSVMGSHKIVIIEMVYYATDSTSTSTTYKTAILTIIGNNPLDETKKLIEKIYKLVQDSDVITYNNQKLPNMGSAYWIDIISNLSLYYNFNPLDINNDPKFYATTYVEHGSTRICPVYITNEAKLAVIIAIKFCEKLIGPDTAKYTDMVRDATHYKKFDEFFNETFVSKTGENSIVIELQKLDGLIMSNPNIYFSRINISNKGTVERTGDIRNDQLDLSGLDKLNIESLSQILYTYRQKVLNKLNNLTGGKRKTRIHKKRPTKKRNNQKTKRVYDAKHRELLKGGGFFKTRTSEELIISKSVRLAILKSNTDNFYKVINRIFYYSQLFCNIRMVRRLRMLLSNDANSGLIYNNTGYSGQDLVIQHVATAINSTLYIPFVICFAPLSFIIGHSTMGILSSPHCFVTSHLAIEVIMACSVVDANFASKMLKYLGNIPFIPVPKDQYTNIKTLDIGKNMKDIINNSLVKTNPNTSGVIALNKNFVATTNIRTYTSANVTEFGGLESFIGKYCALNYQFAGILQDVFIQKIKHTGRSEYYLCLKFTYLNYNKDQTKLNEDDITRPRIEKFKYRINTVGWLPDWFQSIQIAEVVPCVRTPSQTPIPINNQLVTYPFNSNSYYSLNRQIMVGSNINVRAAMFNAISNLSAMVYNNSGMSSVAYATGMSNRFNKNDMVKANEYYVIKPKSSSVKINDVKIENNDNTNTVSIVENYSFTVNATTTEDKLYEIIPITQSTEPVVFLHESSKHTSVNSIFESKQGNPPSTSP